MADYYSILDKTISRLPDDTVANRELVYGKARLAIARQLRALEPTPSDAAIARQMDSLEQAIKRIEADHSFDADMDSVADAVEAAISKPEVPTTAPVTEPIADPTPESVTKPISSPVTEPVSSPVTNEAPDVGVRADLTPQADVSVSSAPSVSSVVPPATPSSDIGTGGDAPNTETLPTSPAPQVAEPNFQAYISQTKPGIFSRILPYLIGIAIVGGGAYGLWLNKDQLLQMVGGMNQSDVQIVSEDAPKTVISEQDSEPVEEETPDTSALEKESTRLGGNGENVVPDPVFVDPVSQPNTNTGDEEKPLLLDSETNPTLESEPAVEETAEAPVEVKEVGEDASDSASTIPASAPGIAQKAYFYEEGGANGSASRSDAAIIWSLVQESPSNGDPVEAVVKGRLDIPDKSLSMLITLKRNTDEGLPASHIIELNFEGAEIDNVARFVMKATEEARGDGLVAVPAKIDNGYFLIALNNLPQAVESNTKLLLDSGWIDIPLGYVSGRRALVTLEKGVIGDKVFRDAFEDWKSR